VFELGVTAVCVIVQGRYILYIIVSPYRVQFDMMFIGHIDNMIGNNV
jgi:hypothetical protein